MIGELKVSEHFSIGIYLALNSLLATVELGNAIEMILIGRQCFGLEF
jgi:hypothetical protein